MHEIYWLVPNVWHFVAMDGTKGQLACTDMVRVDQIEGPHDSWGMLTDYCDRKVSPNSFPVATVAFAATRELAVFPFVKAAPVSLSKERLEALIRPMLDSAATDVRSRLRAQAWFMDTQRDSMHSDIASASLDAQGRFVASIFATRIVGDNLHDRGCYPNVSLAGWIFGSSTGAMLVQSRIWPDDCDYKMASGETPHALFEFSGDVYVLSSEWGYESSNPRLFRVHDSVLELVELRDN